MGASGGQEGKGFKNVWAARLKVSEVRKEIFWEVNGIHGVRPVSIRGIFETRRWQNIF